MAEYIEVEWQVSDGYVSGNRPQRTKIQKSDIEFCDTEEEVKELVESSIQDSFERKVAPEWEQDQMDKVLEYWKGLEHEDNRN